MEVVSPTLEFPAPKVCTKKGHWKKVIHNLSSRRNLDCLCSRDARTIFLGLRLSCSSSPLLFPPSRKPPAPVPNRFPLQW